MQFDEVKPEHFSTISRDPFPHILIDRALLQISGGDARAAKFRVDALAALEKIGVPPTLPKARTGELTPPGMEWRARSKRVWLRLMNVHPA